MLLYSALASIRLNYITSFIANIIGLEIIITTDRKVFSEATAKKINYSNEPICTDEYQIKPHSLLFQNTINTIDLEVVTCRHQPCFFTSQNDSHGFDIFAATFYLITRYEEYLPHEKDSYGRFAHINSLAYKHSFLHLPIVNIWLNDLMERLSTASHKLSTTKSFKFTPTYDIDIAYTHKYQSIIKNIGGFFKDLMRGDLEKVIERANFYSGNAKDPFDVYDWLDDLHQMHQLQPIYFFLLAEKRSVYDKNVPPKSSGIRQLIQRIQRKYQVGIHPSWQSGDDKKLLINELLQLEKITHIKCSISRQHYIRLTLPETYKNLISAGITADYSMGYGSINGFRASVASPFYWFDLKKNEATNLLIHPFCWMDANSYFEQHLSADEAFLELQQYYDSVKKVNGNCTIILHNNFLTEQPQWLPWRKMYERFLSMIE